MRLKTGVDLVSLPRFERALKRHGPRLLRRLFTPAELEQCAGQTASLAARFAAKEAAAKALGVGIGPVSWLEIEVLRAEHNAPRLHLHGAAQKIARELGVPKTAISLSHDGELAIAFVTLYGEP